MISHKFLQCGFSQLHQFKTCKQPAILCVSIPSVHHLKEKTVSLAMLWLINTSRCIRDKLEIFQSLTRYIPGNRSGLWKRFPFHCCSCWNDLNLLFFSCLKKKKTTHLEPFVGLYTSSVRAWSQIWLEISRQSSNDFGGLKSSEISLMQRINTLLMRFVQMSTLCAQSQNIKHMEVVNKLRQNFLN